MHFIHDPAVVRELGPDLVSALEQAVLPNGDCSACGRPLGEGGLRFSVNDLPPATVLVATVHASCGTADLQHGNAIGIPDGTWTAAGFALPLTSVARKRSWFGRDVDVETKRIVPWMLVNPACDVFLLDRGSEGTLRTPAAQLLDAGFVPMGRLSFPAPGLPHVAARVRGRGLEVTVAGFGVYSIDINAGFREVTENAEGVVLAITHNSFSSLSAGSPDPAQMERLFSSEQTVLAWIPAEEIENLTEAP